MHQREVTVLERGISLLEETSSGHRSRADTAVAELAQARDDLARIREAAANALAACEHAGTGKTAPAGISEAVRFLQQVAAPARHSRRRRQPV
jgi:hypothetical protein